MRLYNARLAPGARFENRTYVGFDPNARTVQSMPFQGYQGAFFVSTTWNPPVSGTYEIHCVGGGGGGSSKYGGPGGSGFYATNNLSLDSSTTYTITIGAAGTRNTTGGSNGGTGGQTSFHGLVTANGGTGGTGSWSANGGSGGSGGGGGAYAGTGRGGSAPGYDGSNGSPQFSGQSAGAPGTGQLGVAWGLGTNERIPGGGAGGFLGYDGVVGHPSAGYGGRYRGIYGFGEGRGGGYGDAFTNWKFATGRGCGGGSGNWYNNSAGDGVAGMIVWRLIG